MSLDLRCLSDMCSVCSLVSFYFHHRLDAVRIICWSVSDPAFGKLPGLDCDDSPGKRI